MASPSPQTAACWSCAKKSRTTNDLERREMYFTFHEFVMSFLSRAHIQSQSTM
jgi:hypothetical protein